MPNAASLIPTPSTKSLQPKTEYQNSAPASSDFAGLLDSGTEQQPSPPPLPDRAPPRAQDARTTSRSDAARDNRRTDRSSAPDRQQDQAKDTSSAQDTQTNNQTASAVTGKTDSGSSSSQDSGDGKADPAKDAKTDSGKDGNTDTTASAATEATDTLLQVVTPVAVPLVVADQAADAAATSETASVDAVTATTAAKPTVVVEEAAFSLSPIIDKQVQTTPTQQAETEEASAQAQTAIAAATQPAQAPHLKQAHKAEKSDESGDSDTGASETTAGNDEGIAAPDHAELLKATHAANEAKARRPEHMADGHSETKATDTTAAAPVAANSVTTQQTPAAAGLVQTPAAGAVNGTHAVDANAASRQAADGTVPIEGLAVEITTRAKEGKNRFEIRLDPPELGRIDVRLDIDRQGNVTSRLLVDRADTLDLLRRDFNSLERALNDAGLKTDSGSLQFAMRDQSFAGSGQQQQNESGRSARVVVPGEVEPIQNIARYNLALRSGVDIRV